MTTMMYCGDDGGGDDDDDDDGVDSDKDFENFGDGDDDAGES